MKVIPPCRYLIRKGEEPDPGRANIFPYTEALAKKVKDFEPFTGELPPLTEKQLSAGKTNKESDEELLAKVRRMEIITAIDQLDDTEFTNAGHPKLDAIRLLTGYAVSAGERDIAWARHKRNKNRVSA